MVTVANEGRTTKYVGAAGVSVTWTVSAASTTKSSNTLTMMVADGFPARMVTVPERVW